jgi:hypothetical protein
MVMDDELIDGFKCFVQTDIFSSDGIVAMVGIAQSELSLIVNGKLQGNMRERRHLIAEFMSANCPRLGEIRDELRACSALRYNGEIPNGLAVRRMALHRERMEIMNRKYLTPTLSKGEGVGLDGIGSCEKNRDTKKEMPKASKQAASLNSLDSLN